MCEMVGIENSVMWAEMANKRPVGSTSEDYKTPPLSLLRGREYMLEWAAVALEASWSYLASNRFLRRGQLPGQSPYE